MQRATAEWRHAAQPGENGHRQIPWGRCEAGRGDTASHHGECDAAAVCATAPAIETQVDDVLRSLCEQFSALDLRLAKVEQHCAQQEKHASEVATAKLAHANILQRIDFVERRTNAARSCWR